MKCPICRTDFNSEGSGTCPQCGPRTVFPPAEFDDAQTLVPAADRSVSADDATRLSNDWADALTGAATTGRPAGAGHVLSTQARGTDDTGPLDAGQSFGARYHVIRLLGTGGMGAVYQAWDAELGVAVAIKVIRPSIMADPTTGAEVERRFKRELLLARQVTHTNVVRIHDLGDIAGIKYITMSYVDGIDLATRLKREGKQSTPDTLRIARAVVSGLAAAHAAGVVHRDLKPANIMIGRDGEALIMDFGIALSTGSSQTPQSSDAVPDSMRRAFVSGATTSVGSVVGTIDYMAPEQARAEPVDQRTDIYSFGLILYDTLVGRRRVEHNEKAIDELQRRLAAPPPPLKSLVPDVPKPFADLVMRCVEADVTKRYQTTAELAADLARLDENGELIPIRRVVGLPLAAAIALLLSGLSVGVWWYRRPPAPPPDPVGVVIADFDNRTNDAAFDQTLEPMLKRALEEASFISAYDRSRIRPVFRVQPPEKFDEDAARELAVNQGQGVVLAGFIDNRGNGYEMSVRAAHPVTREILGEATGRAARKDDVLEVTTRLVARIRKALGDKTSDSAQLFAMRTISGSSLEAVGHYAAATQAVSRVKYEEARDAFKKALEVDPKFGIAYQGLAVMSRNLGQLKEAEGYIKEALRYLDGMTEREQLNTRGYSYWLAGNYDQCVKEYGELLTRYKADATARNQRAGCLLKLRKMDEALDEMREAVTTLPKHLLYRGNLAILAAYAGEFETAQREALAVQPPTDLATQASAFAQLGQGLPREAAETYERLATMSARGASGAAAGLGDLAVYDGRFTDAARIFEEGAARDLAAKNPDGAAMKFTSLAYARLAHGQTRPAVAAAEQALEHSTSVPIRFLAARTFVEAGAIDRAQTIAAAFATETAVESRAYGKIVEGQIALKMGDPRRAIVVLNEANSLLDTWLGHFDLGRAYFAADSYLEADSEFGRCLNRRGEALSLLTEDPTYGHFPIVYYHRGRARQALNTEGFADSYREYLAIRGTSTDDPLVSELRRYAPQ